MEYIPWYPVMPITDRLLWSAQQEHMIESGVVKLVYSPFGGGSREVTVTLVEEDINNGRPGFEGVTETGESVWGYADQIYSMEFVSGVTYYAR